MSDDQTIDEGPKGFLDIFSSNGDSTTPDTDTPEPQAATETETAAETAAPDEEQDDGSDLTAEERVAANLAASLEEDGVEPEAEGSRDNLSREAEAEIPDGEVDLDALTPEELRKLAEEAIALKAQVSSADEEKALTEVQRAESAAAALWQQREQTADIHYRNELQKRLDKAWDLAQDQDNPKQYYNAVKAREEATVEAAKQEWLQEQANGLDAELQRFRQEQLKPFYARQLVKEAGLPASAAKELLEDPDWTRYEKEVKKLVAIRDLLAEREASKTQAIRAEGRKRLIQESVVVPASGRARAQKRVPYEGTAEEGISILKTMSKMR